MNQQIAAAQIRLDIARKDLDNHLLQIENAQKTEEYLRTKFTNRELYDWMVGQVSSVYFRAYQLAFDVAKRAERSFRHELALTDSGYIRFGYWDSLHKGLMTAEALQYDIKRMESAYLEQNKREYELTRHISLAQLDPLALVQLKSTGKCTVSIPETVFDMDHPGQYMRRLKSVSLSIPCVAGPYSSVSCKLSLVSNKYRKSTTNAPGAMNDKDRYVEQAGNDGRFVYNVGAIQSISTSAAQNDTGMFELNFRDERYLPFEGAGAISTWQLEMPTSFRQFDYASITDVIIHVRYTARDGGKQFKDLVEGIMRSLLNEMVAAASGTGLFQAFNLRQEFPNEWHKLKRDGTVAMKIGTQHFPYFVQGHAPTAAKLTWLARLKTSPASYTMGVNGTDVNLAAQAPFAPIYKGDSALVPIGTGFTLTATNLSDLEEVIMVVQYTVTT